MKVILAQAFGCDPIVAKGETALIRALEDEYGGNLRYKVRLSDSWYILNWIASIDGGDSSEDEIEWNCRYYEVKQ